MLRVGDTAPAFEAPDQDGNVHRLHDYRGRRLVMFFYPRDETMVCTREVCAFQDDLAAFRELDVPVLGVSGDSIRSHKSFAANHGLHFPLLSARGTTMISDYGCHGLLGRTNRTTYLIGPDGRIEGAFRRELSGKGHVEWAKRALAAARTPATKTS